MRHGKTPRESFPWFSDVHRLKEGLNKYLMKILVSLQIISLYYCPVLVPADNFHHFFNGDWIMIRNDPEHLAIGEIHLDDLGGF